MSGGFSVKISQRNIASIVVIIIFGGILRFSQIIHFHFDFDQQVPAEAAYSFFVDGRVSLIGQELSFPGFFLGPINDWIQFIPYGLCNLKPDCAPFFSIVVSLFVLALSYFLLKAIYGAKIAAIVVAIFALSSWQILFDLNPNSNLFLLLSSVGVLYSIAKYYSGDQKFLILGAFICGIAIVNFNPVFIFTAVAFLAAALVKVRLIKLHTILLAIGVFSINLTPIFIFNLRHENIIFDNFVKFLTQNTVAGISINPFNLISQTVLPFYSNFLYLDIHSIYGLLVQFFSVALLILGLLKLNIKNKIEHSFLLLWIFVVVFGFTLYKGHIPEYYFIQIILPLVIIGAIALKKNIYLFLMFVLIFALSNFQEISGFKSFVNYQSKKKIVNHIISDTSDETFDVIYEVPLGFETGYDYLFKINNNQPQENGKNLYIVGIGDGAYTINQKYGQKFQTRKVKELKIKENVHVVSVK